MSPNHLDRSATEIAGRPYDCPADTIVQISHLADGMDGKRLGYNDLTA